MTDFVTMKEKIHDFGSEGHGSGMAFSPDGDILATGYVNDIWLWRVSDGKRLKKLLGNGYTNALMYSPDGKTLLSSHYYRLMVWDTDTHECKFKVEIKSDRDKKELGYSPLGTTFAATINYNNNWQLWDATTFNVLYSSDEYTESITALDYAPSGKTIAIGSSDKTVGIWSLSKFKLQNNLQNSDAVTCIKYSPDGQLLAVGCQDSRIHIWDVANGNRVRIFSNHDASITELFWFSGKEIIASSSEDGDILFWQISDGKFLDRLSQFKNSLLNPNKQIIATSNNHLQLWKVETKLDVMPIANTQQENEPPLTVDQTLPKNPTSSEKVADEKDNQSPWIGIFLIFLQLVFVLVFFAVLITIIPWYSVIIVAISGFIAFLLVIAAQLLITGNLSQENFMTLMRESIKQFLLLRGINPLKQESEEGKPLKETDT